MRPAELQRLLRLPLLLRLLPPLLRVLRVLLQVQLREPRALRQAELQLRVFLLQRVLPLLPEPLQLRVLPEWMFRMMCRILLCRKVRYHNWDTS